MALKSYQTSSKKHTLFTSVFARFWLKLFTSIPRTQQGLMNNVGLIAFLAILLLFVDWCSWRIVRLPLDSFYLTRPFLISSVLSALAGFLFAPVADNMKIHHFRRRGKLMSPSYRKPTPAMGGLFFVPIGIFVARRQVGSSTGVNGAAIITLIFAMVGFLDDISNLVMDRNRKIPHWMRLFVQVNGAFSREMIGCSSLIFLTGDALPLLCWKQLTVDPVFFCRLLLGFTYLSG